MAAPTTVDGQRFRAIQPAVCRGAKTLPVALLEPVDPNGQARKVVAKLVATAPAQQWI
jgi:hypothetical protein